MKIISGKCEEKMNMTIKDIAYGECFRMANDLSGNSSRIYMRISRGGATAATVNLARGNYVVIGQTVPVIPVKACVHIEGETIITASQGGRWDF